MKIIAYLPNKVYAADIVALMSGAEEYFLTVDDAENIVIARED